MKAILISIQPKWVEKICCGSKTIEVRKTRPKMDTPFKCYIYETNWHGNSYWSHQHKGKLGKVIGEFICDRIEELTERDLFYGMDEISNSDIEKQSCVDIDELLRYKGKNDFLYGWHISDIVIYDEPKALSEFYAEGDCDCMNCKKCAWFDSGNGYNVEDDCNLAYKGADFHKSFKPILRAPQSWCYVEEKK